MAGVNVTFPGNLAQVQTAQDLRSIPSSLIASGDLYLVNGLQGLFEYDTGSVSVDDGTDVIRPYDKTPLQAGRWIRNVDGLASGPQGDPGPANSTYTNLALLKAAPSTNRSYTLIANGGRTEYAYVTGDFAGRADDVNVVKLDAVPLSTGALVRQSVASISAQLPVAPAVAAPAIVSQQDVNTLAVDLLQFIPRNRWDATMVGTSNYAEDDALDTAIAWCQARFAQATLRFAGRRLRLDRSHDINVRRVAPDFTGTIDSSQLPLNAGYAFKLSGRSNLDAGGQLERTIEVRGLKLVAGPQTPPATERVGIMYENIDHVRFVGQAVRGFGNGISLGADAYILGHVGGALINCRRGFKNYLNGSNAGERITFDDVTFGGNSIAIDQQNAFGDTFLNHCSLDYPAGNDENRSCLFIQNSAGRITARDCHFEGNSSGDPKMGNLPAFINGGDGAYMEISGEVIFQDAFNQYLVDNQNVTCPVDFHIWLFNNPGIAGRLATGVGSANITIRTPQGGGQTTSAGLVGNASNLATQTLRDFSITRDIQEDGSQAPTSPYNGRSVVIAQQDDGRFANGKRIRIARPFGGPGEVTIAVPLPIVGGLTGMALKFAKTGAGSGPMFLTLAYGIARRNNLDVTVIDRTSAPVGVYTQNFVDGDLAPIEIVLAGTSARAPFWATHAILTLNIDSLSGGAYDIGDLFVTELG